MALNLIRNSRVFFTTNLDSTNKVATSGFSPTNTFELQVQDGFSFSQNTGTETITLNEAGAAPVRGQRSFNTSLDPVDWSFATYIRPTFVEGSSPATPGTLDADDTIGAEESVLWNALAGTTAIGGASPGWVATPGPTVPFSTVAFGNSNAHQLQAFGLIIIFDAVTYVIDNCALDSATIDFGLDAIASCQWAGKGTTMRPLATAATATTLSPVTFGGGLSGTAKLKDTSARYIANKLSTMSVVSDSTNYGGIASNTYTVALTGGSISINNNLTYLTPANLGVVNQPVTYFTGTRAITSSVTAYLKSGSSTDTAALLKDILAAAATNVDNKFAVTVDLGGSTSSTRVSLSMPTAMLTIPTIASEQVISTSITINPQSSTSGAYDVEAKNELTVKYYSTAN
jgi:hypothetical protein